MDRRGPAAFPSPLKGEGLGVRGNPAAPAPAAGLAGLGHDEASEVLRSDGAVGDLVVAALGFPGFEHALESADEDRRARARRALSA